jgi:RHS repeat-associated protein
VAEIGSLAKYTYLANGSKSEAENGSGVGLVYRGSLIYRKAADGTLTLEGASLPEGRLTVNGVRWHVKDHLGSVRAVVDGSTGNLLAVTDYDAYGEDAANSTASPYLSPAPSGETFRERFTGKEDQGPDFGTAYTDFGARQYSPTLRRWLVPDPLSEKYYGISPYAYCAGNPVNLVDPKGDSLAVLTIGIGHLAMLIQDETGKWYYYSINGDNQYYGSLGFSGGRYSNDIGIGPFTSVDDFLNGDYNQAGKTKDEKRSNKNIAGYSFLEALVIPTTSEQDALASEKFIDISRNEEYSPLCPSNHCSTTVERALIAAGINLGKTTEAKLHIRPSMAYKNVKQTVSGYVVKKKK